MLSNTALPEEQFLQRSLRKDVAYASRFRTLMRESHKTSLHTSQNAFYRVDTSDKINGSGIGLSVARAVADNHKGRLTAELPEEGRIRISAVLR